LEQTQQNVGAQAIEDRIQTLTPGRGDLVKRAMDLALGIPLLIGVSPLMALIAVAIKLTSPGSALFFQRRVTLDGRVFNLVKFRTMRVGSELISGPIWARVNDPRCTPLGHFLRWISLDELPQLWNVVTGKMSLVGPRPERPVFVEKFRAELPGYNQRHTVKAGLTGWAQINGWRGDTSIEKRLEFDLAYINTWSPLLDLKIILRTVTGGFLNRSES
jgi:putative colanic acid biosynthesis UDP-glucose lipid carrier transferase